MIRFLPHVRVVYFGPELAEVLAVAALWSLVAGVDVEVNSIDDSGHGPATLHGQSLAIDLDPAGDRREHERELARFLARRLSAPWQVLLESDHVHCEWDTGRRVS